MQFLDIFMNYIFIFTMLLTMFIYSHCSKPVSSEKLLHALIDQHNQPTPSLLELLKETDSPHAGTFESITQATQLWLRPAAKERWQVSNDSTENKKTRLLKLFENLCLVQKVEPLKKSYTYAILFGSTLDDVRDRLSHLITLWDEGIHFNSLIILASERPLDTTLENQENLLNNNYQGLSSKKTWHFNGHFPTTESEMIKFVFEQAETPAAWNNIPHVFINTPLQKTNLNELRRPNTEDTIIHWLKEYNPQPGSILAISNQPFIGYQNAVLQKNIPQTFSIETVGSAYHSNESITSFFDTLARWIYNQNNIIQNQQAK